MKSNIGHTQAAAGVAGVIKMAMALRHERLPRTLNVDAPTTEVDWNAGAVALLTQEQPWQPNGRPRRAGVSSFGVSGTNAHVVLEEAPREQPEVRGMPLPVLPWVVSGRGSTGVRAQAERLLDLLEGSPELNTADVALSLTARAGLEHRAVMLIDSSSTREQSLEDLARLVDGVGAANVLRGSAEGGRMAFLFTGQGAQRVGMGKQLHEVFPAFAVAFDEVCAHLDPHLDCPMRDLVFKGEGGDLDGTALAQPALFALEVALYRLLEAWGVRPDFLIGHSVGELAAAHVAGVLSLPDACRLVAARGRLMGALPAGGAMAAIAAAEQEMLESIAGLEDRVAVAAVNAPGAVVVSGDEDAVAALVNVWEGRGRRTKRLRVSHAFHSPHGGGDAGGVPRDRRNGDVQRAADPAGVEPRRWGCKRGVVHPRVLGASHARDGEVRRRRALTAGRGRTDLPRARPRRRAERDGGGVRRADPDVDASAAPLLRAGEREPRSL